MGPLSAFELARVLQDILRFVPDRIALHGQDVSNFHAKLLKGAGYHLAAVDLYACATDQLATAQLLGAVRRFPQGDCRLAGSNLLGIGVSAISALGSCSSQNVSSIGEYCHRIADRVLPIAHGAILSRDQLLRRAAMQMLLCDFALSVQAIEQVFAVDFNRYFGPELEVLRMMQEDGLLTYSDGWISIEPKGRLLTRKICAVFAQDAHCT
jgi:oxygen-independent coproporphyrinogen-3 oxidase